MNLAASNLPKLNSSILNNIINQKSFTIIGFSMFFGWLLAVPFEGQVLYRLVDSANIEGAIHNTLAIAGHFIGLFTSGFFIRKQAAAKMTMVTATVVCISGSLIFFLPFSVLWYLALVSISFFSGLFVASWGFYFKIYASPGQRLRIAADVIILSNLIMILINMIAINVSALLALSLSIAALFGALLLTFRLDSNSQVKADYKLQLDSYIRSEKSPQKLTDDLTPMIILSVFILLMTVNSGLMYQVVVPAFSHFVLLTSYYWAIPYILALLIIRNFLPKTNLAYILYVALAMIGISYILFMLLDRSVTSYLMINTLMLGAFGVFDLFWWSILGSFFDYYDNPVQVWGIGLSMNVLGILIGGIIGSVFIAEGDYQTASVVALIVVFAVIILLPVLNNQLAKILKNHEFVMNYAEIDDDKQDIVLAKLKEKKQLTGRETEIIGMLLRGYTYRAIADNLHVSENTIKYHVKNIYQKLNINSKMELINLFTDNEKLYNG